MLQAVEDWAVEFCMQIAQSVVEEMQIDGHVYGDVELNRQQRILSFEAMVRSGEMNSLIVVNPKLAREYADEYSRDIVGTPPYTGRA